jgi:hypothetical protein
MRPAEIAIDGAIFLLIAASCWMHVAKWRNLRGAFWRWVLSAFGLLLVSASSALFISLLARLVRSPGIDFNVGALLALVRSYTRFYPASAGLFGAALGLFGKGGSRWTIVAAGILISFRWFFLLSRSCNQGVRLVFSAFVALQSTRRMAQPLTLRKTDPSCSEDP